MNKGFFPKLAASNIKKNAKTYIPYMLTCIITIAMYYMLKSLSLNAGLEQMIGAATIAYTLNLGTWVTAIFALIFLFYTNSFLLKRRKKEFGVFNMLGMEKKHLARVVGLETVYVTLISLAAGLGLGIALDKVMYLLITKLIGGEITLGFYISGKAVLATLSLFGVIFLLIYLNALRQIYAAKTIELLHGSNVGEKEPKTKWVAAVFGLICLAAGYYLALTTKNPIASIFTFFIAVLLVIAATYLLFTSGSIALLKLLRKNKGYYYRTSHFISISGMIYRMKQNAVGLANICILSTMVLVMVSSTTSLMIGIEDILHTRYPYDITVYAHLTEEENDQGIMDGIARIKELQRARGLSVAKEIQYTYLIFSGIRNGDTFIVDRSADTGLVDLVDKANNLYFVPLPDYNRITGEDRVLRDGEIMLYSNRKDFDAPVLKVFDREYTVAEKLENFLGNGVLASEVVSSQFIVVPDMEEIYELYDLQKEVYGDHASDIRFCYGFDMDADAEVQKGFYNDIQKIVTEQEFGGRIEGKAMERTSVMGIYAGLFFIGIFLGALFIMAAVLIIYYKQISEGYDDRERFAIMQKVGMSRDEVKASIRSQVLTVFFLPLVAAGIHVAFAFPIISQLLALLNLMNTDLYIACTAGCFLVFALIYVLTYGLTARTYYRIISR